MTQTLWTPPREQASDIWKHAVAAVESSALVEQEVQLTADTLDLSGVSLPLATLGRVCVVGAGKAGAGMAAGFERALPEAFLRERVHGWVNVPADCLPESPLKSITLHPARPAGVNEPTAEGVVGTQEILQRVATCQAEDVCLVLISGGGSALLPAPIPGVSLAEKLQITRAMSRAGATIEELNLVRTALSAVKGGGLLRTCRAGQVIGLIISDVVGDPLPTIASGPTIEQTPNVSSALTILNKYSAANVTPTLRQAMEQHARKLQQAPTPPPVKNRIIGSNRRALEAAGHRAEELGFRVISLGSDNTGSAAELGERLIEQAFEFPLSADRTPLCLLCGGETTVQLNQVVEPGKGGRNQEVAVAALATLERLQRQRILPVEITLLAAGTDGEDGPTDAAGGFADLTALATMTTSPNSLSDALWRHDAYPFLSSCQSLFQTGPTHTNVMDLAVVLIHPAG